MLSPSKVGLKIRTLTMTMLSLSCKRIQTKAGWVLGGIQDWALVGQSPSTVFLQTKPSVQYGTVLGISPTCQATHLIIMLIPFPETVVAVFIGASNFRRVYGVHTGAYYYSSMSLPDIWNSHMVMTNLTMRINKVQFKLICGWMASPLVC